MINPKFRIGDNVRVAIWNSPVMTILKRRQQESHGIYIYDVYWFDEHRVLRSYYFEESLLSGIHDADVEELLK